MITSNWIVLFHKILTFHFVLTILVGIHTICLISRLYLLQSVQCSILAMSFLYFLFLPTLCVHLSNEILFHPSLEKFSVAFLTLNVRLSSSDLSHTLHKKLKFSIKYFFIKCDQICRKLRIWSHLLKKFLMENFIFCAEIIPCLSTF